MGHKDIQTTMDIYADCTEEKKKEEPKAENKSSKKEQDVLLFRTHPDSQEYSVRNAVGIRVLKGKRVFSPTVVLQSFQTFCIIMHNKPNLKSKSIVSSIEKNL